MSNLLIYPACRAFRAIVQSPHKGCAFDFHANRLTEIIIWFVRFKVALSGIFFLVHPPSLNLLYLNKLIFIVKIIITHVLHILNFIMILFIT